MLNFLNMYVQKTSDNVISKKNTILLTLTVMNLYSSTLHPDSLIP